MRLRLDQAPGGLWIAGPSDGQPRGTLRRAQGLHPVSINALRSRWGCTTLYILGTSPVHSLAKLGSSRYIGAGTALYVNGLPTTATTDGTPLAFVRLPPSAGVPDQMFVAGGNPTVSGLSALLRIDPTTNVVVPWGIPQPLDKSFVHGFDIALVAQKTLQIDAMHDATAWFASSDPNGGSAVHPEAVIVQTPPASIRFAVNKDTTGYFDRVFAGSGLDLTRLSDGTLSPDEDWISMAMRVDRPRRLESVQFTFDVGDGNFNDTYSKELIVDDRIRRARTVGPGGLGDVAGVGPNERTFITAVTPSKKFKINTLDLLGKVNVAETDQTWVILKMPKASFVREGLGSGTWANVIRIRITIRTNTRGAVNVYMDDFQVIGGVGMQGDYKYLQTYKSSNTGTRSNANPTPVGVRNVQRQGVQLSGLPSPAAGVSADVREIWRTLGNGEIYFHCADLPISQTTFLDEVADYDGLHSETTLLLGSEELPTDNLQPSATFGDAFGPHEGRVFWCRDSAAGAQGRVYYSPVGRYEAVQGFVTVTNTDDTTQKGVIWNGSAYVWTTGGVYEIVGTGADDVFVPRKVAGVPGTTLPASVIVCGSYGVAYMAQDGLRLFTGFASDLLGFDAVGPIFRGETAEDIPPTNLIVGTYRDNEYVGSSGVTTLAYNLATGAWRNVGVPVSALYTEPDTDTLLAGRLGSHVVALEDETVTTDEGTAIDFVVQTGAIRTTEGKLAAVQYIYLDVDLNGGGVMIVRVLVDDLVALFAAVDRTGQAAARERFEYPIMKTDARVAVQLFFRVTKQVTIYAIEADVYQAESSAVA